MRSVAVFRLGRLLVMALAMLAATDAMAWTATIDCEGGSDGTPVVGRPNAFTEAQRLTVYASERVASGSGSCRMGIEQGSDGWGDWGAILRFPAPLVRGTGLWIRLRMYVPEGFDLHASPWLKFMRVHTIDATGGNNGYLDWYINPPGGKVWSDYAHADVSDPYTFYYEGRPHPRMFGRVGQHAVATGRWQSFELFVQLDDVSVDDGGSGRVRTWLDGELIGDFTDQQTLVDKDTSADAFFLFTYWNGGAPATQSLYVDDVVVTTEQPANVDAAGNPMIGPAPATSEPADRSPK